MPPGCPRTALYMPLAGHGTDKKRGTSDSLFAHYLSIDSPCYAHFPPTPIPLCPPSPAPSRMLRHNQLSGTLPASWSGMKELTTLGLNDNALSGSLPAQWSAMRKLVNFRLHDNVFDGSLPATWATMSNLDLLFLRNNFLKSSIPPVWFDNSSGSGLLGLQVLRILLVDYHR